MSGRDFEKSIQEKAHELRLKPSPELWAKVEAQIREKRRRRGFFWFMMAAAIVAGSLSFWFLAPTGLDRLSNRDQLTSAGKPPIKADKSAGLPGKQAAGDIQYDSNLKELDTPVAAENLPSLNKPGQRSEKKKAEKLEMKKESTAGSQLQHSAGKRLAEGKNPEKIRPGGDEPRKFLNGGRKVLYSERNVQDGESRKHHPQGDFQFRENNLKDELGSNPEIPTSRALYASSLPKPDFSRRAIAVKDSEKNQGDRILADSLLSSGQNLAKKNKWITSIQAGAGWSSLHNGLFHGNKSAVSELQNSIALPPANVAGGGMQRSPSDVKAGPAFQIGFALNRATGKRTSVNLGIQYAYQSNRIRIGQPMDSASVLQNGRLQTFTAGNVYTGIGNEGTVYHNAYHYLQIPLEFSWNPDNRKKIFWTAGLTIGYLVGTDALSYNADAGVYYKDKSRFNSWMAAAQTGLYYRFRSTGKWQIAAGPFVQYQLNPLDKTGTGNRMLNTGFGLRLYPNIKLIN